MADSPRRAGPRLRGPAERGDARLERVAGQAVRAADAGPAASAPARVRSRDSPRRPRLRRHRPRHRSVQHTAAGHRHPRAQRAVRHRDGVVAADALVAHPGERRRRHVHRRPLRARSREGRSATGRRGRGFSSSFRRSSVFSLRSMVQPRTQKWSRSGMQFGDLGIVGSTWIVCVMSEVPCQEVSIGSPVTIASLDRLEAFQRDWKNSIIRSKVNSSDLPDDGYCENDRLLPRWRCRLYASTRARHLARTAP